jgi:bifunctional UDP-N-acetylglucosamine pyrophosphorylase / glucosamine-1-phosphate N-acetyltransferase
MTDIAVIVLAAGMGTRMKSALPKVLHKAAGRTLLGHVLAAAAGLNPARAVVVAGPGMEEAAGAEARRYLPDAVIATQHDRKGTGHAVSMAHPALEDFDGTVLVLYGDCPLIREATLKELKAAAAPIAVLGFRAADPSPYGRLIQNPEGKLTAIVEQLDASPEQRAITLCNSGVIAVSSGLLWKLLPKIKSDNAKGEIYLTDLIGLAAAAGHPAALVECPESDVTGVNDRVQLSQVEAHFQARYRAAAMKNGATLISPESVFFSADTRLGQDIVIEPHVFIGPDVSIGNNVVIHGHSHIEGARIGDGAKVGPFARLRPGAEIGEDAHIGNYVEIKKSVVGKGAKVNHLTYIGDADIGPKSNIGAGTITCNYDGYDKHRTVIGASVFVGSNTALVAPVTIGDGVNIAAGSVITKDIPADALAIARPDLDIRAGWAARYRQMKSRNKKSKA